MSRTQSIAFFMFSLLVLLLGFNVGLWMARWLELPGNWPWVVAFLTIPVVGRLTGREIKNVVMKRF